MEDADAGVDRGLGSGFPLPAEVGDEAGTGERGFVEELGAAIAVDAGSGGDEEHLRRMAKAGKGGCEGVRGLDSALDHLALVGGCPATGGEVCAREMDGGGESFKG
jgi:hypothetical protein